jgi:hypothetical protein
MTGAPDTIRIFIPLAIRSRNGRPRILPPANTEAAAPRTQDPHVLRAIACAWGWLRKIETGEVATIRDIAVAEKVSERFVSRTMRPQPACSHNSARVIVDHREAGWQPAFVWAVASVSKGPTRVAEVG